jgi:hypothetical protein
VWPINYTQVYVLASPVDKLCWSGVTRTRQKHHTTTNGVREPRLHQAALGLPVAAADSHTFGIRNCLLTQFSSRPSRRKRAAVRAAKARLSRMLSGV